MEVKMPNATGEGMQSLSTLVVSSIFPSGLLNTVNLGHLYYLTLSVIGGQGVKSRKLCKPTSKACAVLSDCRINMFSSVRQ